MGAAPRAALALGDFDVLAELGDGSFATVLRARLKKGTEGMVALKVMAKAHIVKEGKQTQVQRERRIMDSLEHPGVVRLLYTFQDAESLYMGLELCAGGELYALVKAKGCMPNATAAFYSRQLLDALRYMHNANVMHRDVKPENVLIDARGHAKLCDFGSARDLNADPLREDERNDPPKHSADDGDDAPPPAARRDERTTSFVGTAEYLSPEALGGGPPDAARDLWALGCVAFQMLVGRPPFRGPSDYLTFQKILKNERAEWGSASVGGGEGGHGRDFVDSVLRPSRDDRLADGAGMCAHPWLTEEADDAAGAPVDAAALDGAEHICDASAWRAEGPHAGEARERAAGWEAEVAGGAAAAPPSGNDGGGDLDIRDFSRARPTDEDATAPSPAFLMDGERVVMGGEVKKWRHFLSQRRWLMLTDRPRLLYFESTPDAGGKLMGEVPLEGLGEDAVRVKDARHMTVATKGRDYVFEHPLGDAASWGGAIRGAIAR